MSALGDVPSLPSGAAENADPPRPAPLVAHIHTHLPNIWVGYVIAFAAAALLLLAAAPSALNLEPVDLNALGLICFLVGWVYWLFCVHRIHRALKEATADAYTISPRRSVGFQFIPFYSWVWGFKWPKRIAEFVNSRSDSRRMSKYWPGVVLLIAAFLGQTGLLAPLHLLLLFGTGHYIARKLKPVLPPFAHTTVVRRREHQLNLAASAGVGAVFAFKLFQAFWNPFKHSTPSEIFHEILAIVIVSLGVILFIEPLAEMSRARLGLEERHTHAISRSWRIKVSFFMILALSSLAHGFLHRQIEDEMGNDPVGCLIGIAGATLISGGITYAWVSGACRVKPRAARFGVIAGAVVGLFVVSLIFGASRARHSGAATTIEDAAATRAGRGVQTGSPVPADVVINVAKNSQDPKLLAKWQLDLKKVILPWTLLGLIGGLAVDRKWGRRPSRNVAFAIFVSAAILFPGLGFLAGRLNMPGYTPPTVGEQLAHILAIGGWALSLSIYPFSDSLLAVRQSAGDSALTAEMSHAPAA
jgi:hypothetical protein